MSINKKVVILPFNVEVHGYVPGILDWSIAHVGRVSSAAIALVKVDIGPHEALALVGAAFRQREHHALAQVSRRAHGFAFHQVQIPTRSMGIGFVVGDGWRVQL